LGVFSTPKCQLHWWLIVIFKVDTPETPTSNFVEIKWREYSYENIKIC
jgi:hypothetical protein